MRPLHVAWFALALCLAGCNTPSAVGEHYGEAVRANRDAMIANPGAPTPTREGLEARSAEHVLENYSKGQEAQEHRRSNGRKGSGIVIGEFE